MQRFLNPNPTRASRSKDQGLNEQQLAEIAADVTAAATPVVEMPPLPLAPAPASGTALRDYSCRVTLRYRVTLCYPTVPRHRTLCGYSVYTENGGPNQTR